MSREPDISSVGAGVGVGDSVPERKDSKSKKSGGNSDTIQPVVSTRHSFPPPLPSTQSPPPVMSSSPIFLPPVSSTNIVSTTVTKNMSGLVNECDLKEMNECLACHPKLADVFKSSDDLIHALKVISLIKPHEKFSTSSGIYIQTEIQHPSTWMEMAQQYLQPVWLIRMKNGEDRITNLKAIKSIFVGAFLVVEESLQEREQVIKPKDSVSRIDIVKKLKNEQVINRMAEAITKAVSSMENLKQTYTGDAHACARIDMLTETIRDRLALIRTSLDFLK
jgi:hypothetical protein